MDAASYFRGKKITVMGLGLLGGVGDIKFLAESGADIIATDLKGEEELQPSLEVLKPFPNIRYTLGRHDLADFKDRDLVIKAPGTPLASTYIAEARKNGIEVTMWSALFARFAREAGATLVGITGTRGKSSVTAMIAAILRAADASSRPKGRRNIIEGGNVQGTSVLPQLAKVSKETVAVLELDSWKLQGFGEAKISPNIGLFTTFYPDHLNYYKGDLDTYLADKANIFINQKPEDTLILGAQCAPSVLSKYGPRLVSKITIADVLPSEWQLSIPGEHNRYDAALALATARALNVSDEVSRAALESFRGVPGRLELIAEKNGVKIYNDTTSTTPESTIVALEALGAERTVIIAGGTDKDLPLGQLVEKLRKAKALILLEGSGTNRFKDQFEKASIYGSLSGAVQKAMELAKPGDSVLLSPGFTSFGMFKNEYDRGDQFNKIVKQL